MKYLMVFFVIGIVIPGKLFSQTLEIEGKARITIMELANTTDSIVVVLPDGTLAIRETSSFTNNQSITLSNDTVYLSSGGFVILPPDLVDDADADPTNEIQVISQSGDTVYLSSGGFVILPPDLVDDADADPANEIQVISQSGDTIYLSSGGFVVLPPDLVDDADADPTNEIQVISQSVDTIYLSSGGFVILPPDLVDDADADPANEIETWSTLIGKPSGFADDTDNVEDADSDPTNEIQTLTILEDTIKLSGGGSIILPVDDVEDVDADSTNEIQTLTEVLSQNNDGGAFQIKNIGDPTADHDAATKAYVDLLETTVDSLKAEMISLQGVTDIDNNRYEIVTIGTQTWMAENLKTTRYNDGTAIPLIMDGTAWNTASFNADPGYCFYDNASSNLILYGALYNWHGIDSLSNGGKNVCPTGWHVPTDAEWMILTTYLGGTSVAGGKLKEAGRAHWNSPNTGGTNESGFAGLPGGFRIYDGPFYNIAERGNWWSATDYCTSGSCYWELKRDNMIAYQGGFHGGCGMSVRCIKD